ncbi:MAG: hypothetical protein FWB88_13305 [Defluviitaleaceae bacterium]|nr:hypothetical protein [Defluviitaleaceae bacterium]MCL2240882.1 hypothetical protein [Defluviitaleaceae bacterium]
MKNQAMKMEEIKNDLIGAKAVAGIISDYFEPINPDKVEMEARYRMCGDLSAVLIRLIHDATKAVDETIDELWVVYALEKGAGE